MRSILILTAVGLGLLADSMTTPVMAQAVGGPMIHRVTLREDTGVLTITGVRLSPDLLVAVEDQAVPTLHGATETEIQAMAPAALLTTPGAYRLTVTDPVRRVGDTFVVVSPAVGTAVTTVQTNSPTSQPNTGGAGSAPRTVDVLAPPSMPGPVSPLVIEDPTNFNTAIGALALTANSGIFNTASGYAALHNNGNGFGNTANGAHALHSNVGGSSNTATGHAALSANTSGEGNTATGHGALALNTSSHNTATGSSSLFSNTTGTENVATGSGSLTLNTTGSRNTATGVSALARNESGSDNVADGWDALFWNIFGTANVAIGKEALYYNVGGSDNAATGEAALYNNKTGSYNTASGNRALGGGEAGHHNAGFGYFAGHEARTGSYNIFVGAGVIGAAPDTNTIRVGLPYDDSTAVGQNRTFIAGIWGAHVSGHSKFVVINSHGQLGVLDGGFADPVAPMSTQATTELASLQQQVREQHSTIADLRARLARLEALQTRKARRE